MAASVNPMDDPAPSYEESVSSPQFTSGSSKQQPIPQTQLPLQTHLADTRTQRIENILSTYIDPLLMSQGASGLYKTTFVLIPSTVSNLQDSVSTAFTSPQEPQVIGFPSNEVVKLVRLKGEEHAMEFWRQPAVISELTSHMKTRLAGSGHRIYDATEQANTRDQEQASTTVESKPKRSFWGRSKAQDDVIVDRKWGWRAEEQPGPQDKIPTGMVSVAVVWKEVTLRIANDMGLYESKKGPGLCISTEVGT